MQKIDLKNLNCTKEIFLFACVVYLNFWNVNTRTWQTWLLTHGSWSIDIDCKIICVQQYRPSIIWISIRTCTLSVRRRKEEKVGTRMYFYINYVALLLFSHNFLLYQQCYEYRYKSSLTSKISFYQWAVFPSRSPFRRARNTHAHTHASSRHAYVHAHTRERSNEARNVTRWKPVVCIFNLHTPLDFKFV